MICDTHGKNCFSTLCKYISAASHNMDVRTVQNWLNRLPDGWNSPQSPDELVIQKRGRRKSIVWSPDLKTYKRHSLLRYDISINLYMHLPREFIAFLNKSNNLFLND